MDANSAPNNTGQEGAVTGPLPQQPQSSVPSPETQPQPRPYSEPTRQGDVPLQAQSPPTLSQDVPPYSVSPLGHAWDKGRGHPRSGGLLGPLILVLLGVLFLLNNFGIVDWSIWSQLWRLWPLVLIAVGLELLVGRRSPALSLIILLLLVAAAVAFLLYSGGFQPAGGLSQFPVNVPSQNTSKASVDITFSVGDLSVDAQSEGSALATGSLDYYDGTSTPQVSDNVSGDTRQLTIKQNEGGASFPFFGFGAHLSWTLHLSNQVPMTLRVEAGAGTVDMNLERLRISDLNLSTGAGDTSVILPSNAGTTIAKISGGAGTLDVTIPNGVEASIKVNSGIGKVDVDPKFAAQGDNIYTSQGYANARNKVDLTVNGGVGRITISSDSSD